MGRARLWQQRLWQHWFQWTLRCLIVIAPVGLTGCFFFGGGSLYAPEAVVRTPPMSWHEVSGVFELKVEAPNPGWRIEFDGAKASPDGPRLLFTLRRPDPGMIFSSRVVEKSVRTDQPASVRTRVWVRVLNHGETEGLYAPTDLLITTSPETQAGD